MRTDFVPEERLQRALDLLMPENALAVRVCEETGLRIGDALALRPDDLAREPKPGQGVCFSITEQKTGKRRRVCMTQELRRELLKNAGPYWVFEGRCSQKKHRTRQAVWKDLKRAAKALRMVENVGTHSARKAYAVELMRKYGDIDRVRRALNHNNAEVTMIYALADRLPARKRRRKK